MMRGFERKNQLFSGDAAMETNPVRSQNAVWNMTQSYIVLNAAFIPAKSTKT